jgi:hypothetical protein
MATDFQEQHSGYGPRRFDYDGLYRMLGALRTSAAQIDLQDERDREDLGMVFYLFREKCSETSLYLPPRVASS